jgi:Na+/H+ antiporter NhaD/arsenite permease-like protein
VSGDAWVAVAIFLVTYAFISTERIDRTIAALLGGVAMVVARVIDQETAFAAIDFNVIFLLAGMMMLAGILRRTGFFQWVAIRSVKVSGGEPIRLLLVLCVVCAVLSAFLDNVTTVVLLAPITLYIAATLGITPLPFLIAQILASNVGGTATLIGDPPNILIGSAAGLDFTAFLVHLAPVAIVIFGVLLIVLWALFRGQLAVEPEVRDRVLGLDEREMISDPRLLRLSLTVILATIAGFLLARPLHYEVATVALLGATSLLLLSGIKPEKVIEEIEWKTLLFFVGLFMLVEGIVHTGVIRSLGDGLFAATGGDIAVATLGLLWFSGIASGIVDNIPYTATMIPVVQQLGQSGLDTFPLWWALALGACLGGNLTIVGASANVVVANLAEKADHPISFRQFLPYGIVVTAISLVVSTGYLWVRYLA